VLLSREGHLAHRTAVVGGGLVQRLADLTETITLTHTDPNLAKAKITATEDQLLAHAGRGRTHVWATQQPWHNP